MLVIGCLKAEPRRFQALKRAIDGISQTMLTRTLREMERSGLVSRDARVDPLLSVTYSLTPLGRSLATPLAALRKWAEEHMQAVTQERQRFDLTSGRSRQTI